MWSAVRTLGHDLGVVAFSWCGYTSSQASFERQKQAIDFTNSAKQGRDTRYTLKVNEFPFFHIPRSLQSTPRQASLKPVEMSKPLLYAYTDGKVLSNFNTHWQHSPDSKSLTNLLTGYSKCIGENRDEGHALVQKPESLAVELILRFTNPGDYVLVPFAGTGTEVVACIKTGRNVVAFEKDKERFDLCKQRVDEVVAEYSSLNGPRIHWRFPTVRVH